MNARRTIFASACVLAALWPAPGSGQAARPQDAIVGTWKYVSVDTVRPDGTRQPMYGERPQGLIIFDASGHYALLNARSDLPKLASNDRLKGTPDEYKAVVQGSIAHFGRYTVDDAGRTITFQIETSTFANWDGVVQKRPFELSGDSLKWTTPNASGGGSGEIVLQRVR